MSKHAVAGALALALVGAGTAAVAAQEPTPQVDVAVASKTVTVTGADALGTGPTRFTFRASGKGERGFVLFRLRAGVTREQAASAVPNIKSPSGAKRYGTFVASGFIEGAETYTTTIALEAAEYVVVDFSNRPVVRTGFRVGPEASTAVAPVPVASVGMDDYGFDAPATLPSRGVLRVTNDGKVVHHALAFPLRRGVNSAKLLASLRRGQEPKRTDIAGAPKALVEIVSPGTQNDVEVKLKPGRTLLVCFLSNTPKGRPHSVLGMAKVVTVE